VDGRGIEIDLLPANIDQLVDPQRMPEGHEDEQTSWTGLWLLPAVASRLSISPSVRYSRCQSAFGPTTANCRLFRLRGPQLDNRIHWQIPR
jgi:hypothetical protein